MNIRYFRVADDGDSLEFLIDIPDNEGYEDLTIDKIAIQDHLHYTVGYPPVPQIELTPGGISPFDITNNKKVMKVLFIKDMGITSDFTDTGMFFLYISQAGVPGEIVSCEDSKSLYKAVAISNSPIYNKVIKLIEKMNGHCPDNSVRKELVDITWKREAFRQAINLEEYTTAIQIYNDLLFPDIKEGDCLNACGGMYNTGKYSWVDSGCKSCR